MRKNKNFKKKIATLALATTTALTSTALVTLQQPITAKAENVSVNYSTGAISPVSVSNGNFNSNSSSSSLSAYDWTSEGDNSNLCTSGAINTGNGFEDRMTSTYRLSKNPMTKSSDNYVLMINSKADGTSNTHTAKRGYRSSSITLQKNSFYSFQVSFKSDSNYNTRTDYVDIEDNLSYAELGYSDENPFAISSSVFNPTSDSKYTKSFSLDDKVYIKFDHPQNISNTYFEKKLTKNAEQSESFENVKVFYQDDNFVGFIHEEKQYYVSRDYVFKTEKTEESPERTDVHGENNEKFDTYTADNFKYDEETGNFIVADNTIIYTTKTEYDPLNNLANGSFYLEGLTKDGKTYKLPTEKQFVRRIAQNWTTLYYFIATGNEEQTVTLNLWLGSQDLGSTGVVFFDDCKGYRYSENEFWKAYQKDYDKTYVQQVTTSDGTIENKEYKCTNIVDLRDTTNLVFPVDKTNPDKDPYNFDFEKDPKTSSQGLVNWTATGNARVFSTRTAGLFKNETGYDFVGSNLSYVVDFDGEKVDILNENKYVLAVWADKSYSKATSSDITIHANEIYKITAQYKISELSGNAYMFIKENDSLTKDIKSYTISDEQASAGVSSNADNDFVNDYGTIEFFVKGGAHHDTSFNLSLGIGKKDEQATGCVLFDNIQITNATTEEYNAGTNKFEFDSVSVTRDFTNGSFRSVNVLKDKLPSADGWTNEADTDNTKLIYNGVVNTSQYDLYLEKYNQLKEQGMTDFENPYYFVKLYANPKSANGEAAANNIYMMANHDKSYQKLTSNELNFEAGKNYNISFKMKTDNSAKVRVSLVSSENPDFVLFKTDFFNKQTWSDDFNINIKSNEKSSVKANLIIELGGKDASEQTTGVVYLDDFSRKDNAVIDENSENLVDMTNYFANLPTNNLTEDMNSSFMAYKGERTSGTNDMEGAIIKITSPELKDGFSIEKEEDTDDDFAFFMTTQGQGAYTFTSNFNVELSSEAYVISFRLKTSFKEDADENNTYNSGVNLWLDGYKKMANLRSDDGYEEFKYYIKPSESKSIKLYFSLESDANVRMASAVVYNIRIDSATDYDDVSEQISDNKHYDVNTDRVFVTSADDSETDTETPETPDSDSDSDKSSWSDNAVWLLIPSLIMAAALIIAIIGYFLRKIKLKKIQIKHAESYNRKDSLNVDAIKQKASEQREAEIKKQKETIDKFQKELEKMETEHKEKVIALRQSDKGKVSKETDKEFKHFAQKRTVLAEKLESLNRELEEIKSPEHLLSLERKIYAQEESKRRELERRTKKQNKQLKKQSKEDDKPKRK